MKSMIACLLIVLLLQNNGCVRKSASDEEEGGAKVKATVPVRISLLRRGDLSVMVQATGKTEAIRKEKISSPTAGKIISLKALVGEPVQAGDVLAVVRTKESQEAISGAETLVREAQTSDQKAGAERALQLARATANTVAVRATFSGVIAGRGVSEGDLVDVNAEIFTVVDLSTLVFVADVPVHNLSILAPGQNCEVRLQTSPTKGLAGRLEAISPQTDVLSQTVKVRLGFLPLSASMRNLLKTDMVGEARITTGIRSKVFIVPRVALLRNDESNTYSLVTFTPDSLAFSVPVILGATTDSTAEVSNLALKEGMPVIMEGQYALADSTRITVTR